LGIEVSSQNSLWTLKGMKLLFHELNYISKNTIPENAIHTREVTLSLKAF